MPATRQQQRPRQYNWNHGESTFVLGRGNDRWGAQLKEQRIGIVALKTDDAEINFGLLMRDDEPHQIRVAFRTSVLTNRDIQNGLTVLGTRHEWQVLAVARHRILERRDL